MFTPMLVPLFKCTLELFHLSCECNQTYRIETYKEIDIRITHYVGFANVDLQGKSNLKSSRMRHVMFCYLMILGFL